MFRLRPSVLIARLFFFYCLFFTAHQREDRALRDYQVCLTLERDLDGGLPEEQRVVADSRLHWNEPVLARTRAPGLVAQLRRIGHGQPRSRRYDLAALHRLTVERRGRQVEAHFRALL